MSEALLAVHNLTVKYRSSSEPALNEASFTLAPGECLGIFGNSGSGKTTLARTLLGIGSREYRVTAGSIRFRGREILGLRDSRLREIRGRDLALIGQEPELALNPVLTVGSQIAEVLRAHSPGNARCRNGRVREMLAKVCLDDPGIFYSFPHQLSGGQRQRVAIAQALVCNPTLLIADEPTSSLDAKTQAEILRLLTTLKEELRLSLILISHNAEVLRSVADRTACVKQGRIAEEALPPRVSILLSRAPPLNQQHLPGSDQQQAGAIPLIEVRRLSKEYRRGTWLSPRLSRVAALAGVDFTLLPGQIIALVGESGSGKSTFARCLARLEEPDAGEIRVDGKDVLNLHGPELRFLRRRIQLVFQHSGTALNPFHSAGEIVGEPLEIQSEAPKRQRRELVSHYMELVGLSSGAATRRAWQFSGGQRQRLAIARAMILNPDVVIFDEALVGLDMATRSEIIDLLLRLHASGSKSYIFITHDLEMAQELTTSILVMQNGKMAESSNDFPPASPRVTGEPKTFAPHVSSFGG